MFLSLMVSSLLYMLTTYASILGAECIDSVLENPAWIFFGQSVLFGVLYLPILTYIFQLFDCETVQGDRVLRTDPDTKCSGDLYNCMPASHMLIA